ncbi:hypothetical protein CLV62_12589 [Dysgonomonas alginatilytica]|uniref:Uncharacterized protein n=1 Tax=Dysgonomonas alginatilytica TaxID=1605892 RepID=A0A2V3PM18_9BACT|nr:hypothetical protein [Dysgonomonas alginatilytica]PXV61256.1 hypothetical protein CLV62_12589 [Dysgonomonas alginatilytica]
MQTGYELLLPEGFLNYFEVVEVDTLEKVIILHLDEKVLSSEENKDNQFIKIVDNVNTLIRNKYMIIDTDEYSVAMLDNLYDHFLEVENQPDGIRKFEGEAMRNFCNRLKTYCDFHRGFNEHWMKDKLLISLKYKNNDVIPYAYFDYNLQQVIKY